MTDTGSDADLFHSHYPYNRFPIIITSVETDWILRDMLSVNLPPVVNEIVLPSESEFPDPMASLRGTIQLGTVRLADMNSTIVTVEGFGILKNCRALLA